MGEGGAGVAPARNSERTGFEFASRWIHASNEAMAATRVHGRYVVTADAWTERENNGRGFDTTNGNLPRGQRPKLDGYVGHAMQCTVSVPSTDPAVLAAGIHELDAPSPG